jgi:hypothetical protein
VPLTQRAHLPPVRELAQGRVIVWLAQHVHHEPAPQHSLAQLVRAIVQAQDSPQVQPQPAARHTDQQRAHRRHCDCRVPHQQQAFSV